MTAYTVITLGLGGTVDAVKIRKQGNSLAVTIDQPTLTAANLHEGDLVVPSVQRGLIVLTPVEVRPKVRSRVLEVGRKVIRENRGALDRLAKGGPAR